MESSGKADFIFVNEPPQDYLCPVCAELLTEPFLNLNCGHHICRTCRGRLLASRKTECPVCRKPNSLEDARLNLHFQRLVYDLMVYCKHHEEGCKWKGELRSLQEHLDPVWRQCDFVLIPCSFGCGEHVRSGAIKEHKHSQCRKRPSTCEHCSYYNARDIVTKEHYPICEEFPVECPNKCQAEGLKRSQLQAHVDDCPLQVIACPFSIIGCTVQLPRREMETHTKQDVRQHFLVLKPLEPKQEVAITLPSAAVCPPHLLNLPPVEFTMTNYLQLKEADEEWISPPFFTHARGYKMCLKVVFNGYGSGKSTHVSVFVCLMKGKHDNQLQWPFEGDVIIELPNWREDKGHYEKTICFNRATNEFCARITETNTGHDIGFDRFISHSSLSYNPTINTEYLQDDCLRLRVKTVAFYSTPLLLKTPVWQDPLTVSQSLYEFTVTEFSKRKKFNNQHYSPPFYSHPQGYTICLKVYPNGYSSSKDTHVSVYVCLMKGKYDDQLQWPCEGQITIELLNWREDKRHHKRICCFQSKYPLEENIATGTGYPQFISHSSLSYNPTTNTEYLQDDCLQFRVK